MKNVENVEARPKIRYFIHVSLKFAELEIIETSKDFAKGINISDKML